MKGHCRWIVIALSVIIAVLIAVIGVISWCYIPIKFEGSPNEMRITRLDGISFDACDIEAGKLSIPSDGYHIRVDETNIIDRIMLYDILSDIEITDTVPEFDEMPFGGMPALRVGVGNTWSRIGITCDTTRSYIRVRQVMKNNEFAYPVFSSPVYYTVNPEKVSKLVTHIIARAEKLYPEMYSQ